jgi:hypothetical protein
MLNQIVQDEGMQVQTALATAKAASLTAFILIGFNVLPNVLLLASDPSKRLEH